jgi:hypothetical protein
MLMLDQAIREKLRDPAYLDLHLTAVMAIGRVGRVEWYDSHFLRRFEAAKLYLSQVRPDALEPFVRGFDVLLPPADFRNLLVCDLFDASTREQIRAAARAIPKNMSKTTRCAISAAISSMTSRCSWRSSGSCCHG